MVLYVYGAEVSGSFSGEGDGDWNFLVGGWMYVCMAVISVGSFSRRGMGLRVGGGERT